MLDDLEKLEIMPVLWAKDRLQEIKSNWFGLMIITARREDLFKNYTEKWLSKHYNWIFDDIIYANHFHKEKSRDKSEICIELWITEIIEDNFDYALDLANKWIKAHLIEKPWNNWQNINHENIIRVKNWWEIII